MGHNSKFKKTQAGFLLEIEDIIGFELPKSYKRVSIEDAAELLEAAKKGGFAGLQNHAGKMGLPFITKQLEFPEE